MVFTKPFAELSKHDTAVAGGKGASLGEMTQAGIPVPPGFVVLASAFEHFCAQADLTQEIDAILGDVDTKAVHTVEKASERIQALINNAAMPDDIAREILAGFRGLGSTYVAVRSSATAEDSADHAWAGQLDSFLNVTEDALLHNVQKCWASLYTPRAIFYRFEKGLHTSHISVAVVVQTMVHSEKSGIAFSVHPVTEDPDQLIIEAGFGLGEAIVSGQVTPDSYVVSKSEHACIDININDQGRGLFRNPKGGNEWKELGEQGIQQVLSENEILELSTLIKKIEDHYGCPQDIEWAFENGKFYITQSRPITTLSQKLDAKKDTDDLPDTNDMLARLRDLLYSWGIGIERWILTGQYADRLLGYPTTVRSGHLNVVVPRNVVPWDTKDALEVQPPLGTQFASDFEKFIKETGFDFDLLLTSQKRFDEVATRIVPFDLPQGGIKILDPLGELMLLEDTLELSHEAGWGVAKGRRMLSWIESFGAMLHEGGYADFSKEFERVANAYQFLKDKQSLEHQSGSVLQGIGVSKGTARGIARVVTDPQKAPFAQGEIIVATMTDPKFTPLLTKAAAIITDTGGQLCHAAIMARELGIPCVAGTWTATQVLHDGDLVEVDANEGVVRILERATK